MPTEGKTCMYAYSDSDYLDPENSYGICTCRLTFLTPCNCLIFAFRFIWSLASLMANFLASLLSARPALCSVVSFFT